VPVLRSEKLTRLCELDILGMVECPGRSEDNHSVAILLIIHGFFESWNCDRPVLSVF